MDARDTAWVLAFTVFVVVSVTAARYVRRKGK